MLADLARLAYEASYAGTDPSCFTPWDELPADGKAMWARVVQAVAGWRQGVCEDCAKLAEGYARTSSTEDGKREGMNIARAIRKHGQPPENVESPACHAPSGHPAFCGAFADEPKAAGGGNTPSTIAGAGAEPSPDAVETRQKVAWDEAGDEARDYFRRQAGADVPGGK